MESLNLDHLYRMTDDKGLYQFAMESTPDPRYGYCVDDNARALIVAIKAQILTEDKKLDDYVENYLSFIEGSQRKDGRFHNLMNAEGEWTDEDGVGSDDSQGRAVWALGFAARMSPEKDIRGRALKCLNHSFNNLADLSPIRTRAFALLGLNDWLAVDPSPRVHDLIGQHTTALTDAYKNYASDDWRWFENELTYCNARLPQALLVTPQGRKIGLESLNWLGETYEVDGQISLIGFKGWYPRGGKRADFEQQAVDAGDMVSACVEGFKQSGDEKFRHWAKLSYQWFLGKNVGNRLMIDEKTGGCFDGLRENGEVNPNQGAESLLAWLLAWEEMKEMGWI